MEKQKKNLRKSIKFVVKSGWTLTALWLAKKDVFVSADGAAGEASESLLIFMVGSIELSKCSFP